MGRSRCESDTCQPNIICQRCLYCLAHCVCGGTNEISSRSGTEGAREAQSNISSQLSFGQGVGQEGPDERWRCRDFQPERGNGGGADEVSKGPWRKVSCICGRCRKCTNREACLRRNARRRGEDAPILKPWDLVKEARAS